MANNRLVIPPARDCCDSRAGYVYLISEPHGLYKIGQAVVVQDRLNTLQQSTPYDLVVVDSLKVRDRYNAELYLHGALARYHVRNEWFKLPDRSMWDDVVNQYKQHLRTESRPKPIPPPSFNNYNDDIRAKLAKLPV